MASLQRLWAGVLASLKKSKAAYGVLFMNTKAVFDAAAGVLAVEFPAENDFAFRAVQKPDVQTELAAALRQEAHADVPFELRKAGAAGGASVAAAPAVAPSVPPAVPPASFAPAPLSGASEEGRPAVPASAPPTAAPGAFASASPSHPASAPAAPSLAADDRPPYDDYVPYGGDDDIPFEDPFASRPAPAASATSAAPVAPAAPEEVPPWESAPVAPATAAAPTPTDAPSAASLPPEPDAVSGPSPNPVEEPDLAASLAFGFGDGAHFEEVL